MKARNTVLLMSGAIAAPLIAKAARPFAAYAIAGGLIVYEAACDAIESSGEVLRTSLRKMGKRITRNTAT